MLFSSAKEKLRKIKKKKNFLSLLVPSLFESYKSKSLRIKLQYTKSICQKSHKIIFTNLTKNYNKSDPKLNFWYKSEEQQNGDYFVIMILMRKKKWNFFSKSEISDPFFWLPAVMDELEFRRLLERFPIVRFRDYHVN